MSWYSRENLYSTPRLPLCLNVGFWAWPGLEFWLYSHRGVHMQKEKRTVFVLRVSISTNVFLSCFSVHAEFRQRELQKTHGKFSSACSWVLPSSTLKAHSRLSPYASPSSLLHQKIWASFALPVGPQVSAQKLPQMPLVKQKHGLSHWPLVGW